MGLMSRGMAMIADKQAETDGVTVTYQRPLKPSFTVTAVMEAVRIDQEEQTDIPVRVSKTDVDFVIRIADFETAQTTAGITELFRPDEGDKITRTVTVLGASATAKYRVFTDSNIPPWDWGETEALTYRIHARVEK